ncbi:hypothetical protein MRF4_11275 [Methylobacterium radiotolerans]
MPASAGLEGGLQGSQFYLEGSFEASAALRHLRMRAWTGNQSSLRGLPAKTVRLTPRTAAPPPDEGPAPRPRPIPSGAAAGPPGARPGAT